MIQIRVRKDQGTLRYGPVLICDMCRRPIENITLALYKWQENEQRIPLDGTFVFLHKGTCDDAHERAHHAEHWHWSEGATFLGYLVNATQMTSEKPLWPFLIKQYCPDDQLEDVRKIANQILEDPDSRPPSLHEL